MTQEKQEFINFIADKTDCLDNVLKLFEAYHLLLLEANRRVNLISRQVDPDKIWTFHFYDSLLPLAYNIDFRGKKVLDLGTGGGLPGIPLAIILPDINVHLLDSRGKKIAEVDNMIKKLDLNNCSAICKRLEEVNPVNLSNSARTASDFGGYDIIVCRSVLMTGSLIKKALRHLNDNGYLLLYKAKELEEELMKHSPVIYDDVKLPWRERKIVLIRKAQGKEKI